jgi:hypothetical protein
MNIGDTVVVVRSPYSCVKPGTKAQIVDIKFDNYGIGNTIYILNTGCHDAFRRHEIKEIDNGEKK